MLGSAGSGPLARGRLITAEGRGEGAVVLRRLNFLIRNHIPDQEKKWMVRAGEVVKVKVKVFKWLGVWTLEVGDWSDGYSMLMVRLHAG
jgi:hypothetical protein